MHEDGTVEEILSSNDARTDSAIWKNNLSPFIEMHLAYYLSFLTIKTES